MNKQKRLEELREISVKDELGVEDLAPLLKAAQALAEILELSIEGWKFVPGEVTAENGLKYALSGEFTQPYETYDSDGEEFYSATMAIDWTNIKAIYKAAIAAAPDGMKGILDDQKI